MLPKMEILDFEVAPIVDLYVSSNQQECVVEMLSCKVSIIHVICIFLFSLHWMITIMLLYISELMKNVNNNICIIDSLFLHWRKSYSLTLCTPIKFSISYDTFIHAFLLYLGKSRISVFMQLQNTFSKNVERYGDHKC